MPTLARTSATLDDEWITARQVADRAGISPAAARQRLLRAGISWRRGPGRGGPKLYRVSDVDEVVLRPIDSYAMWRSPECPRCEARLEACVEAYRAQIEQLSESYPGGDFPGGQWRELSPPDCPGCRSRMAITYTLDDSGKESVTWRTISTDQDR